MSGPEKLNRGSPYTVYPGNAAEDLVKDSMVLRVICPELIPHSVIGDMAPGYQSGTVTAKDRNNNPVNTKVTSANYIEATWDGQDFVRYPPMVRKGEPVELFRRQNQDGWRWRSTPYGRMTRKTDRLCFEVSATPTNTGTSKGDQNTYSAEISSVDQSITIRTSNANGEAAPFRFGADLKKGVWYATDNMDLNAQNGSNRVFMDTGKVSGSPTYQINLSSGICLRFVKKDMWLDVPGKAFINVKDRVIYNSPLSLINPSVAGNVIANFVNVSLNTTADVVMDVAGVFGVNSAASKFSGVVVSAGFRGAAFMAGAVNALYRRMTIGNDVQNSNPSSPGNSADTDVSGSGDQATISAQSVVDAFKEVVSGLGSCQGYDGSASSAPSTAQGGTLNSHKGK